MASNTTITQFKDLIEKGSKFLPEAGRYILYASLGCPYALRAAMTREIKGLQKIIEICIVDYHYTENGLQFTSPDKVPECSADPVMNAKLLKELYLRACPNYSGIPSVPMLWDKKWNTIVNNESQDIMRMLNGEFNDLALNSSIDLYPISSREKIEEWNIYTTKYFMELPIQVGNALTQEDYETKANQVKDALLKVEEHFEQTKFLLGNQITESDIKLFTAILRHDIINSLLFRINHIHVRDLNNVMRWIKEILEIPGIRTIVNVQHIKGLSFSKKKFNPSGIIPLGDGFKLP